MARRSDKPEVAVIGLGRFGASLATALVQRGCSVLGIDRDRDLVQELADQLTQTVVLNSMDEKALSEVDITSYDTVIVAIGTDFEANLMTTVALKGMGVHMVISKAFTERQKSILLRVGADRVVLPESEAGARLAQELTLPDVHELVLTSGHCVTEMPLPSSLAGNTWQKADLLALYKVKVLVIYRNGELTSEPADTLVLQPTDRLVVLGAQNDIKRLSRLN